MELMVDGASTGASAVTTGMAALSPPVVCTVIFKGTVRR